MIEKEPHLLNLVQEFKSIDPHPFLLADLTHPPLPHGQRETCVPPTSLEPFNMGSERGNRRHVNATHPQVIKHDFGKWIRGAQWFITRNVGMGEFGERV